MPPLDLDRTTPAFIEAHEVLIGALIDAVGDDQRREDLLDTPARAARAHRELFAGYGPLPKLTTFAAPSDALVVLRDITFVSTCEHHFLPYTGRAHLGYLPGTRLLGLSKLARVVDHLARRLTTQERLAHDIAQAITAAVEPRGVGVVLEARHLCMVARGIAKDTAVMVTSLLTGRFRESDAARAELLDLIHAHRGTAHP